MSNWFSDQITTRRIKDDELFEESFVKIAGAVLGRSGIRSMQDKSMVSKGAIEDILKYYGYKAVDIPDSIEDFEEQIEIAMRPYGLMRRNVRLKKGWRKDSFGPVLAFMKGKDIPVAILPGSMGGYKFIDPESGKRVRVNSKNEELFEEQAICFYRSLPLKKLEISDLFSYLKDISSAGDIVMIIAATALVALLGLIGPYLMQLITGPVLETKSVKILTGMAVFMFSAAVSARIMLSIKNLLMNRLSLKASVCVEAAVMMRVLLLPPNFFRNYSSGELASRVNSVNSLCTLLLNTLLSSVLTTVASLVYVFQIRRFTPALTVPAVLIIIVTVGLTIISAVMQVEVSRRLMKLQSKEQGLSYALISGIRKIKLSGAEKRMFSRWADVYAQESEYQYNPPFLLKINPILASAVTLIGNIFLYYTAAANGIDSASYLGFNAAYGQVFGAFTQIVAVAVSIANIKPTLEMAEPILTEEPEAAEGKEVITGLRGNIEVNNVSFRYSEEQPYILNDFSLKIKSGEYLAIVGRTGCGKSTLMRILLGFEKPERGAVFYDGRDINRIDLKSLRTRIGTVMQSGGLFQGDIYSNITISAPGLSMDEAWEAAEIAGIADDIREMPMGMQTLISEGQGGVSGGQKQRLMIARAIAPKPKILMFDEATSALDNMTQKKVSDALEKLSCTRIVIAHRLSTIKNCDRIIVLEGGRIIEDGNYEELIAKNGYFAELVAKQRVDIKE